MRVRVPTISIWTAAALTSLMTVAVACGDDEDADGAAKKRATTASTAFVPVDPPPQPGLPPGAGPYNGPGPTDDEDPPDDPPPQDSGTTEDTGTAPPPDAGGD